MSPPERKRLSVTITETDDGQFVARLGIPPGYGHAGFNMRKRFGDTVETDACATPADAAAALVAAVWDRHPSVRFNTRRVRR